MCLDTENVMCMKNYIESIEKLYWKDARREKLLLLAMGKIWDKLSCDPQGNIF
jgi:hypothetical protein